MKTAVIVFPGSNCDRDVQVALRQSMGSEPDMVWHGDSTVPDVDLIVVPGGFSYGDYLRSGAMAANSPVMKDVVARAKAGVPVLGICNGFQILCESGLLPGALVRNRELCFVCRDVRVRVEDPGAFGALLRDRELDMPIKHTRGAYVPDPARPPRVAFRYAGDNPNGSVDDIAGVVNEAGNVLGLMPHPEHAIDPLLGSSDGASVLRSFLARAVANGGRP